MRLFYAYYFQIVAHKKGCFQSVTARLQTLNSIFIASQRQKKMMLIIEVVPSNK